MTHPLDRPIWSALASRQADFDASGVLARRFPPEVSPFAAARDQSPEAVAALAGLIPDDDDISLIEIAPPGPPAGVQATGAILVQMTTRGLNAGAGREAEVIALGEDDAAEMLALATLARPGPFRRRTHTLGRFIGIRIDGRLAAMCGERLWLEGFREPTALSTHPDFRGRGYGELLLRRATDRILAEGQTAFLHAYATNTPAIALYRRMGFEIRADLTHAVWKRA
jgi:ribosomal protein S18 acetylase RimI-like enzyme